MKISIFVLFAGLMLCSIGFGQQARLSGTVQEFVTHTPLNGANVAVISVRDTSVKHFGATDQNGRFSFTNIGAGLYSLRISFVGFQELRKNVTVPTAGVDVGVLLLSQISILMGEVVVTGNAPPVVQVGDTIQFNSKAFKLNADATAEDLMQKLPGVTVQNNTVQAQGENVTQIFVDGKRFFGDDPMIALRNLPAEVIDKIQVYDKLSDQSELTGFNDGQTTKTINIITRPDRRRGQFGRLVAAAGDEGKYQGVANVNAFQGDRRLTFIGQSNDINQQNFSTQDFLGAMNGSSGGMMGGGMRGGRGGGGGGGGTRGGGGGGGGGGRTGGGGGGGGGGSAQGGQQSNFNIGQQQGINTTHALGSQYTDAWATGLNAEGSYFFNLTDNQRDQVTNRQYFLTADTSQYYRQTNLSDARNYNHRVNLRVEYTIDSTNEIIFTPRVSLQTNGTVSNSNNFNWLQQNTPLSQSTTLNNTDVNGYTSSGSIIYRHRFDTRGRTVSIQASANLNDRISDRYLQSANEYYSGSTTTSDSLDQKAGTKTNGEQYSSNLAYTEPIGMTGMAQLNYAVSLSNNSTDKRSLNYNGLTGQYDLFDPSMSNVVTSGYLTHHADLGYQYRDSAFSLTLGVGFQRASLSADRTFPKVISTDKMYQNVLPTATLHFGITRTNNIQILYRTSTSPPSISQLENTVDNSNPLLLTAGNPDLRQYYNHSLTARYITTNLETMASFFLMLSGSITYDYIGNSLILAQSDTTLEGGVILKQGSQLTRPINLGTQRTARVLATYSVPVSFISCNVNLNSGVSFNGTPSMVNYAMNTANTFTYTQGLSVTSNISTDLDFTVAYNANFNNLKNTIQSDQNTHYFSHTASLRFNWTFWEGFTVRTDVNNQLQLRSQTGYNQHYTLWNMTFAKKFLADNRGEISVQGFDLLNQNTNLTQTVTDTYIQQQQTRNLNRYFLLTFSYRLSNF